jgi:hypothetical protein
MMHALILYSYQIDCMKGIFKKNENKLARSFNPTFRYIDGILPLKKNPRLATIVDRIYRI